MAVDRTAGKVRLRCETHQVTQTARQRLDATSRLIPAASLGHTSAVHEANQTAAGGAAVDVLPVYSHHEWQLLAEMLEVARQSASKEQKQGSGKGQVLSPVSAHGHQDCV